MKTVLSYFYLLAVCFAHCFTSLNAEEAKMPKKPTVEVETNLGKFTVVLMPEIAPKTTENFYTHAKNGYYNGQIFHRVIKDFMIQGGDPTGTGRGGESIKGGKFADEFSKDVQFDRPYLLAMANAGPGTNGSQFFITTVPTSWLNNKHTIFGEVTEGKDVIKKIETTKVGPGDRPVEEVKILKMTVSGDEPAKADW